LPNRGLTDGFPLYFSHSTPTGELPRLSGLVDAIKAAADGQIEVIYDKEQIAPGGEWRRRIAFMLHACHAAVVLADDNTRQSKWVLTEAIYLSLRNQVDPHFQFIPISFLPIETEGAASGARKACAVKRTRFAEGPWGVVDLGRLQQARGATAEQIATTVVAALRSRGTLVPHQFPVDRLVLQLAPSFGGISTTLLDSVIRRAGRGQRIRAGGSLDQGRDGDHPGSGREGKALSVAGGTRRCAWQNHRTIWTTLIPVIRRGRRGPAGQRAERRSVRPARRRSDGGGGNDAARRLVASFLEIRRYITEILAQGGIGNTLSAPLRSIRAAARKFMDQHTR
jgi:hypothetical protein